MAVSPPAITISALANEPGRSSALALGTSASTISVRVALVDRRADARDPSLVDLLVALDRDPDHLVEPNRLRLALRHRQRAGAADACGRSSRPASRRRDTGRRSTWRSRTMPSSGEVERGVAQRLLGQLQLGAALLEHRLAVAHLLERILITAVRHLQRRVGRVEVGARANALLDEGLGAILASASLRRAPPAPAGRRPSSRGRRRRRSPSRREPEAGPGLAAAPPRACCTRSVEVGRRQPRDDLSAGDPAAEIDEQLVQPARHLQAEGDLFLGGQRARDRDRRGPADPRPPAPPARREPRSCPRPRCRASILPRPRRARRPGCCKPASVNVSAATGNHAGSRLHTVSLDRSGRLSVIGSILSRHRAPIAGLLLRPEAGVGRMQVGGVSCSADGWRRASEDTAVRRAVLTVMATTPTDIGPIAAPAAARSPATAGIRKPPSGC